VPLVDLLPEHRKAHPSSELVFTNSTRGPIGRTSFRSRIWKPAVKRAGLPERLRFHDLRHSYATWLASDGVPPTIVQRIMGHEDVTTTLSIYADVRADHVDRVDGVLVDSLLPQEAEDNAS
jgi:integrase